MKYFVAFILFFSGTLQQVLADAANRDSSRRTNSNWDTPDYPLVNLSRALDKGNLAEPLGFRPSLRMELEGQSTNKRSFAFSHHTFSQSVLPRPFGPSGVNHSWTAGSDGWFTGSNWNPASLPTSSDNAYINNGGTAQILSGTATAAVLTLGQNVGDSGTLSLGASGVLVANQIQKGAGSGTVNFDGGTLRANASGVDLLASFSTRVGSADVIVGANNAVIDTNGFSVSIGSTVSGTGALVKEGAGTLTLSGDYSGLSGGVLVYNGTLAVTGRLSLYPRTLLVAPSGGNAATLDASGRIDAVSISIGAAAGSSATANISSGGSLSANGVHVAGKGTTIMNVTGGAAVPEYFAIGDSAGSTGTVNVYSGSVSGDYAGLVIGLNGGTGVLNLLGGTASGAFVGIGGTNSVVNVSGGILKGGGISADTSCTLNLSGGTIQSSSDAIIRGTANVSGGTWTFGAANINIEDAGTLNFSGGALALGAIHSIFLQPTTGSTATLNVGTGSSVGTLTALRVSGGGSGSSVVNFNHTGALTFAVPLQGSLAVTKLGEGTTTLTAANTYTAGTSVNAGTLLAGNTSGSATGGGSITVKAGATLGGTGVIGGAVVVNSAGNLAPGNSPGRLTLNSSLTLSSGSTFTLELGGSIAGSDYDQLLVGGAVTLTGSNLKVSLLPGFTPLLNQKFFILDVTSLDIPVGTFSNTAAPLFIADVVGNTFVINYFDSDPSDPGQTMLNDVSLTYVGVTPVPEPSAWLLIVLGTPALFMIRRRGMVNKQRPAN